MGDHEYNSGKKYRQKGTLCGPNRLLCRLGHICVPSSERVKLIWEVHYSQVAGHFGVEKTVAMLQKHFYWPKLR